MISLPISGPLRTYRYAADCDGCANMFHIMQSTSDFVRGKDVNGTLLVDTLETKTNGEKTAKSFGPMLCSMDRVGRSFSLTNNDANNLQPQRSPLN